MVKRFLAKTALVLSSILFTLGAFDLTVYLFPRQLLPGPLRNLVFLMDGDTYYVKDPPIGSMIRPHTDYVFPGEEFSFRIQTRLNFPNTGFRGGTLGGPAWGAAFGDSFTFGAGVDQEATWVAQLSRLTNREIINFGVPGHGPHQYTRIFQKYGVGLRPKVVFYALFSNDLKDGVRFEAPQANRRQRMTAKRFMKRYSASYNILNNVSRSFRKRWTHERRNTIGLKLLDRRLRDPYGIADRKFASAWAGIARQIENAHDESKRINATFVLLYFPQKEEVYWELAKERIESIGVFKERVDRLRKTIVAFCGARDLLCFDLTPTLKARGLRGEIFYFPVDIHWNENGNRLVAQEIYRFLLEKKLI
ncbi:MAG: GDSL-type esterase/lipase family protein [Deltaproteobacteria bacterium]|nr:GDSL-type esterase/lipase family protein [Deltaproteobacteria bacterium]MDZ4346596.1 GDSL-type esterase/lipase family protein [Candidatus Binatia bacterium]